MSTMQEFYTELSAAGKPDSEPYFSYLGELAQLTPAQIAALETLLVWHTWGATPA